jgi:hypothetical protein
LSVTRIGGFRKWRCVLCGEEVVEGQRFIYIPGRGYAHVECVAGLIAEKGLLTGDVAALHAASEALSYAIVRLKEAARLASSGEAVEAIVEARRRVEDIAAMVERVLADRLAGEGGL